MEDRTSSEPSSGHQVVARRLGSGAVLVHLGTNQIFELNDTAARVWELARTGLQFTEIASVLADEFDVSVDEAAADIEPMLERLRREGLLP